MFIQQIFTESQIASFAIQFRTSVGEWILKSHLRAGKKWNQILRKNFVYLTQFTHLGGRQQYWQTDLKTAVEKTIQQVCPNWTIDSNHHNIYLEIQEKLNKMLEAGKSPRQDWLFQAAYFWLKSLNTGSQHLDWYPHQAIPVAHAIFASSGKFKSFLNYMKRDARRWQPPINQLIAAYESICRLPLGTSCHIESKANTPPPPPPPLVTTAQYSTAKAPSTKH